MTSMFFFGPLADPSEAKERNVERLAEHGAFELVEHQKGF
jgi:hypothetical protein